MSDEPYRTSDRRVIPALLLGLVALFGAVYVAGYLFTSDRIPRGTTVSGIDIGGLTPVAAETRLRTGLAQRAGDPVRVVANGEPASIDPADGRSRGRRTRHASRSSGGGRSWDPGRMWDYFAGGSDEDAVLRVDRDALDRAVAAVADEVDVPAVEGSVTFAGGEADARYPEKGTVVDRAAAADAVAAAFLGGGDPVELPTVEADPQVGKDAVSRAMEGFANPAMSAAVVVALAGEGVQLQPEDFAPALSMNPVDGELQPELDGAVLVAALTPRMRTIARSPEGRVVPDRPRRPAGGARPGRRDVRPRRRDGTVPRRAHPHRRRPAARRRERRGPAGLHHRGGGRARRDRARSPRSPRTSPTRRTATRTSAAPRSWSTGPLLKPGETFSLNDTVGERTAANGFTKGFIISDGVFKEDFGGGVSQVATTTFNAAFFAGLEDVEHKPHSFYIDRYPVGREATVAWGAVDLRFKNTTPYGVYIRASVDPSSPVEAGRDARVDVLHEVLGHQGRAVRALQRDRPRDPAAERPRVRAEHRVRRLRHRRLPAVLQGRLLEARPAGDHAHPLHPVRLRHLLLTRDVG